MAMISLFYSLVVATINVAQPPPPEFYSRIKRIDLGS